MELAENRNMGENKRTKMTKQEMEEEMVATPTLLGLPKHVRQLIWKKAMMNPDVELGYSTQIDVQNALNVAQVSLLAQVDYRSAHLM